MIDLRWVRRPLRAAVETDGLWVQQVEQVLQYREWVAGMGGKELPVWVDVPVVEVVEDAKSL